MLSCPIKGSFQGGDEQKDVGGEGALVEYPLVQFSSVQCLSVTTISLDPLR